MAKFVCDVEQVIAAGEKLCAAADEMESSISKYSSNVTSDLGSWDGNAKSAFSTQCEAQVQIAKKNAKQAAKLGKFIKAAANSIQSLEEELASLSI